jgi:hypothetical protein
MLDKLIFRNGVVVKSEYLNEVQKASTITPGAPRSNFYAEPTNLDHDGWAISQRDAIKDWELPHPDIEPETNIGRLSHDGIIWGCINCAESSDEPIDYGFNYEPRSTRKNLDNTLIDNGQFGVIVGSGRILDENLNIVSWSVSVVIVNQNSTNYIYVDYNDPSEPIVVAGGSLPSRATPHTPLASVSLDEAGNITEVVDLRHGVYIDSLQNRLSFLRNTEVLRENYTLKPWDRAVVDTSNGEVYITMPEVAVNNDMVSVIDAVGTFANFSVYLVPNGDYKINNSFEVVKISKQNAHTNLFFFEPLNTWLFSDDFLSEEAKPLGDFISCGGWECLGITTPEQCPDGAPIPPQFPNPSEGTFRYDSTSSKCFKKISENFSVYSDGEGGFVKIFNEPRCSKPTQTLKKSESYQIKVDLATGDDNISNDGVTKPFKTVERALLEGAYRRNAFDKISIEVAPDSYYVDNSVGADIRSLSSFDDSGLYFRTYTEHNIGFIGDSYIVAINPDVNSYVESIPRGLEVGRVIYSESGANAVISSIKQKKICTNDCGWILNLRYIKGTFSLNEKIYYDDFSVLNPTRGGVIIPNGVSLISKDLRKTKIHPIYVPTLGDSAQDSTSIFRVTGNTYVTGFTFRDNETYTKSHTKLCAIEFVSEIDLETYYNKKLSSLFRNDPSYRDQSYDVNEIGIVYPEDVTYLSRLVDNYENITGRQDIISELQPINGDSAPEVSGDGFIYYPGKIKFEGYVIPDINNVRGASPYIKSCSIRSQFGLSGVLVDGNRVKGTKSMVISEFTVVSLQLDPNCYINPDSTYYNSPTSEANPKRFRTEDQYRSFGFKVQYDGYAQIVSCFVIGASDHFVSESGGEISVSNSCSNFGEQSLVSKGFKSFAYPQDFSADVDLGSGYFGTRVSKVIPPKPLVIEKFKVPTRLSIDVNATTSYLESLESSVAYRLYIRTEGNSRPSASLMNSGSYAYTTVDSETTQVELAPGLEKSYRNYLCVDAVEYLGGRTIRTTYFTKIDHTKLEYDPEFDDKSQIFKFDPNPPIDEEVVSGTYTLTRANATLVRNDGALPPSFMIGRYFYIDSDKDNVYTITDVDFVSSSASFTPELRQENFAEAKITFVSNDFLGGLWYVDVIDEDYTGDLQNQFRLSLGLLDAVAKIVQSAPVYTYRDRDVRDDYDRIYKLRLKGFDLDFGLRPPQENYILEANRNYDSPINTDLNPLVITNVSQIEGGEYEAFLVTSENSVEATTEEIYPTKNLDKPEVTENPTQSLTYQAMLALSQYEYISLNPEDLIPKDQPYEITYSENSSPFLIELRKPSTIRANSQVWEWVGYLNYETALQNVQGNLFSESDYVNKLIKEQAGGKIYATGSTESGKFVLGNQIINLGDRFAIGGTSSVSGRSSDSLISSQAFPTDYTFNELRVDDILSLSSFSELQLENNTNLQISSSTKITNEFKNPLNSTNSDYDVYASESFAGFIQIATEEEVFAGESSKVAVTPAYLEQKRATPTTYGLAKLSTTIESGEWLQNGTGINPTNVVTNRVLGELLAPNFTNFEISSTQSKDIYFRVTNSEDVLSSAESKFIYVFGSWVSLFVEGRWTNVAVPKGGVTNRFDLQTIGATQANSLYNIYAYADGVNLALEASSEDYETLNNGIVVKIGEPTHRFIGSVYVYEFEDDIYTSINLGGFWADSNVIVPHVYYSNFLKPQPHTIKLFLLNNFPTITDSTIGWSSPAGADPAFLDPYVNDPRISFVTSLRQQISAEASLLSYNSFSSSPIDPDVDYVVTSCGMNLGTMGSTPTNAIHSSCFTGSTSASFTTCRSTLDAQVGAGAYDLMYLFKVVKSGTLATNIQPNKDLTLNDLPHGLKLNLLA